MMDIRDMAGRTLRLIFRSAPASSASRLGGTPLLAFGASNMLQSNASDRRGELVGREPHALSTCRCGGHGPRSPL